MTKFSNKRFIRFVHASYENKPQLIKQFGWKEADYNLWDTTQFSKNQNSESKLEKTFLENSEQHNLYRKFLTEYKIKDDTIQYMLINNNFDKNPWLQSGLIK